MKHPSFQPYYDRIQVIRIGTAVVGFLLVAGVSRWLGSEWDSALIHGIGTAVIMYFLSWLAALTIFAELYQVEVKQAEERLRQHEEERMEQLRNLTESRSQAMAPEPEMPGPDPYDFQQQRPPGSEAA